MLPFYSSNCPHQIFVFATVNQLAMLLLWDDHDLLYYFRLVVTEQYTVPTDAWIRILVLPQSLLKTFIVVLCLLKLQALLSDNSRNDYCEFSGSTEVLSYGCYST